MKILKIQKTILSFILAAAAACSSATTPFFTAYAAEVTPTAYRQYAEDDNIIVFDASTARTVYVDTSDMEVVYLGSNARSQSLPYSGGIAFPANIDYADTPLFAPVTLTNHKRIIFNPTNISGGRYFQITLYLHYKGEETTKYHAITSPKWYAPFVNPSFTPRLGTGRNAIDRFFLRFERIENCAESFEYTLSISDDVDSTDE